MKKFARVFISQIFNAFFPILIVAILLKLHDQEYTASIFLLINFANIYLLFSDYSSNITFIKDALQSGGITQQHVAQNVVKDIHHYIGIKSIILFFGFLVWIILCFTIPLLSHHTLSNILSYSFIVGSNFTFYWAYMSSDKEYFYIVSTFLSRLLLVLILLVFVLLNFNFFFLMPLAGLGSIAIAVILFIRFSIVYKIPLTLSRHTFREAAGIIKRDWPLVTNTFLLMTPTTCLSIMVGFVRNTQHVIVYGLAEKIFIAIRSLLAVFLNSIYPVLCNPVPAVKKRVSYIYGGFYFVIIAGCAATWILSSYISSVMGLSQANTDIFKECLFYLLLTILVISINIPFFLHLLVHNKMNSKSVFAYFSIGAILVVAIFATQIILANEIRWIAKSLLAAEAIITLIFFLLYKNSNNKTKYF